MGVGERGKERERGQSQQSVENLQVQQSLAVRGPGGAGRRLIHLHLRLMRMQTFSEARLLLSEGQVCRVDGS